MDSTTDALVGNKRNNFALRLAGYNLAVAFGRVEDGRGGLGLWPSPRFPSPLISRVEDWRAKFIRTRAAVALSDGACRSGLLFSRNLESANSELDQFGCVFWTAGGRRVPFARENSARAPEYCLLLP
jgi:hypothetical protein